MAALRTQNSGIANLIVSEHRTGEHGASIAGLPRLVGRVRMCEVVTMSDLRLQGWDEAA
jgi:hypothetical protein